MKTTTPPSRFGTRIGRAALFASLVGAAALGAACSGGANDATNDASSGVGEACTPTAGLTEWAEGVAYSKDQPVRYHGAVYRCIQPHTSLGGWTPDAVPALWAPAAAACVDPPPTGPGTGTVDAGPPPTTTVDAGTPDGSAPDTSTPPPVTGGDGLPAHVLVGYWHNFENGSGFIKLRDVSPKWDVINVSFAEPTGASETIAFTPYGYATPADFKADVAYLKGLGKKVVISIGGANGHVSLTTDAMRAAFVTSMNQIISDYGFDGMDIDFEGHSLYLDAGDTDVKNPKTAVLTNLISATRAIHDHFGSKFILTMAPETFFVQVGYTNYGGNGNGDNRAGAYLPVIHALRDILTFLQVQDYNSGPVMGLDDQYHFMGGPDFHVAMTEMVLKGFPIAKNAQNVFPPLRPDQVVLGLPASINAGNGFTSVADVQSAFRQLVKGNAAGGTYQMKTPGGYPGVRGLMAWSVNWDAFNRFEFTTAHRPFLDGL